MGVMRVLNSSGDTTIAWDTLDTASLDQAEAIFEKLAGERKIPFARAAGAQAEETVQIKTFDPSAEEIIWIRPITGG